MTAQEWNAFVKANGPQSGAFLQSWEWGEALRAQGRTVEREVLEKNGVVRAMAQWERVRLPLGRWYRYLARGPIALSSSDALMLCKRMMSRAEHSSDLFLRCDVARGVDTRAWGAYARRSTREVQPSATLIADITLSDDALLAAMHQKTRYNIRLAQKHGIVTETGSIDAFTSLIDITAMRHDIQLHARRHFEAMLEHLHGDGDAPRAFVTQAVCDGEVLASALCVDFAGTRTYVHGASSDIKKNLMAPYALHWWLIRDAKRCGMAAYDWWGIAPEGAAHHRLAGVTRFKLGFGGTRVSSPPTFDVVLRPVWYAAYRAAAAMRRI